MDSLPIEIFLLFAQPIMGCVCRTYHAWLSNIDNQRFIIAKFTNDSILLNSNNPFYIRFTIAKHSRSNWLGCILGVLPPTRIRTILVQSISIIHRTNKVLVADFIKAEIPSITVSRDILWDCIMSNDPNTAVQPWWNKIEELLYIDYVKTIGLDNKNQKKRNIAAILSGISGPAGKIFNYVVQRSLTNYIQQPARAARKTRVEDIKMYLANQTIISRI